MRWIISTVVIVGLCSAVLRADVTEFDEDFAGWHNAAGDFTFIGFIEYPQGTILTDQYADLGITFPEANATVVESEFLFEDGHALGVDGPSGFDDIWVEFDEPITAIGVDFLGGIQFELFTNGKSITGLVSDKPFDKARIFDPEGGTFIDNLYFAPPIPGPGVLGGFAIAALCFHRRRRR